MGIVKLAPLWVTFAKEIKYTYGVSRFIEVNELFQTGDSYTLTINVCDDEVANALRQILPVSRVIGNVTVNIVIFNKKGAVVQVQNINYTPETLAETFCTALSTNPIFVGTVLTEGKIPPDTQDIIGAVVVITKPFVVHFYNEDTSDLCGNYAEAASKVFADISNLSYLPDLTVSFSTFDKNCDLQKNLYVPSPKPSCYC